MQQLLYTDTDSVIVYINKSDDNHVELPTSDLLGDLKDEYEDLLPDNPSWYISEMIAYGPKMYQLLFKDTIYGSVVKWVKTMKGISVRVMQTCFLWIRCHCIGILCWTFVAYCSMDPSGDMVQCLTFGMPC